MTCVFSTDRVYRYSLTRDTGDLLAAGRLRINWLMLNPSTADENVNDPTIRRCLAFSRAWGYREVVVTNLFAFRATDPGELLTAADPVGPDNDFHIADAAKRSDLVLCAWGNHGALLARAQRVLAILRAVACTPRCLRVTKTGQPEHPLYLPGDLTPLLLAA